MNGLIGQTSCCLWGDTWAAVMGVLASRQVGSSHWSWPGGFSWREVALFWQWSAADEESWGRCPEGIDALFSAWVDLATRAVQEDPSLVGDLPTELREPDWFRSHLEAYRSTFCQSPGDPEARASARQVGFAHIYAHVPPSLYVGLYNLMFAGYHALEAEPGTPSLPSLHTVRRRWLSDMQTALDTYTAALNGLMTSWSSLASIDSLTGTLNRRGLWDRVAGDIANLSEPSAFIVWDLDHFKDVNDQHGHPEGDRVLQQLATLEQKQARVDDILGRLGGDEFVWWAPGLLDQSAICDRIRGFARASYRKEGMTFSAGVARYPVDGVTVDELYVAADAALYHAKHGGRQCWCLAGSGVLYPTLVQ
ncbi:MAG: GGDEF domain-containing protein [Actinobacteria bacterium]|nr:GGDEF domain-containing protein [Actinomycetota bacterium]